MNLATIIIVGLIVAVAAWIVYRRVQRQKKHSHSCADCDVEGCSLRELLANRDKQKA